jgi:hypothetical protein|tara:strand:- start:221 stop:484 length:264 start_codon:yes stop_codon:yes gene_type:complete
MKNPFKILKALWAAKKLAQHIEEAHMSKSLFKSKVFWTNVLTAAVELSGALSGFLPPGALQLATNVLNIALRLVTSDPVHVVSGNDG